MDRQVKPAHHLDFSRQHHVMLSGWCLPPTAGTNQATAATAATAALLLLPLLLLLLPLLILPLPLLLLLLLPFLPQRCFCHVAAFASATAPSATFKLLENGIAFALSLSWLLANATAFASPSMSLPLVFMTQLHMAPPVIRGLTCLCHGGTSGSMSNHWPALLFCGDLNCGMNHGTPGTSA